MNSRQGALARIVGFGSGIVVIAGALAVSAVPPASGAAAPVAGASTTTLDQLPGVERALASQSTRGESATYSAKLWAAYRSAIADSTIATPGEVVNNLIAIVPGDPRLVWRNIDGADYVLVQTMRRDALGAPGQRITLNTDRWVAIPAQADNKCRKAGCLSMGPKKLDIRLKQLVGLPPDGDYTYVNAFWVKPADLFRPCTDPRITTHSCPTQALPGGSTHEFVNATNVPVFLWVQANFAWRMPHRFKGANSVSCVVQWLNPKCYGLPWTRLGYTYDWKPGANRVGLSEFIAARGASVVMESVKTQWDDLHS